MLSETILEICDKKKFFAAKINNKYAPRRWISHILEIVSNSIGLGKDILQTCINNLVLLIQP